MDSELDTNNNASLEKSYSLRPRASTARKVDPTGTEQEDLWKPRGRTRKKPKQKSLPLSKYRRKTANARERFRMREINEAFEALRRAIPLLTSSSDNANEKLTKISTLRLAMKYITALSNALQDSDLDSDADSFLSERTASDLRESSTPCSTNDHSDLYDQFFPTSPSSSSSLAASSPYSLSALLTPPPCEHSPKNNFTNTILHLHPPEPLPNYKQARGDDTIAKSFMSSRTCLAVPGPSLLEDELSHHLISSVDLQSCTPSLLDELECISSPSVDLDDYLIS